MNPIAVAGQVIGIIDKFIPDPEAKARAIAELTRIEADLAIKQMDVNIAEASNTSFFVSGWRPAVGWICALAFLYSFVLRDPIMVVGHVWFGIDPTIVPALDNTPLMTVLMGILGLGALRTYEKTQK